jgi:hypothetical protein
MVGFMGGAMRVDRLLGEHGIGQDSAAGRQELERQMERGRKGPSRNSSGAPSVSMLYAQEQAWQASVSSHY